MLDRTFIHVAGIGPITEKRIWERGCHSWHHFLRNPATAGLSAPKTDRVVETITTSLDNLRRRNHRYFSQVLPPREHWRVRSPRWRLDAYRHLVEQGEQQGAEGVEADTHDDFHPGREVGSHSPER